MMQTTQEALDSIRKEILLIEETIDSLDTRRRKLLKECDNKVFQLLEEEKTLEGTLWIPTVFKSELHFYLKLQEECFGPIYQYLQKIFTIINDKSVYYENGSIKITFSNGQIFLDIDTKEKMLDIISKWEIKIDTEELFTRIELMNMAIMEIKTLIARFSFQ